MGNSEDKTKYLRHNVYNTKLMLWEVRLLTNEDMIGLQFGKWTVLDVIPKYKNEKTYCKCQCSCEKQTIKMVYKNSLLKNESQSCGCLKKELTQKRCRQNRVGEKFGDLIVK